MASLRKRKAEGTVTATVEEELLAKKLFGGTVDLGQSSSSSEDEDTVEATDDVIHQGVVGRQPVWRDDASDNEEFITLNHSRKTAHLRRVGDVEGQKIPLKEYKRRLHEYHQQSGVSEPKWARTALEKKRHSKKTKSYSSSDEDEIDAAFNSLSTSAGNHIRKSKFLIKGTLNVTRLNDITRGHRIGKRPMRVLKFHPSLQVLMCAGENGVISLYEIGLPESEENFLQNVSFQNFPITNAYFIDNGKSVLAASRRQEYFFNYNMDNGAVMQVRPPRQVTKMNVGAFSVSSDGRYTSIITRNEVHIISTLTMEYICYMVTPTNVVSTKFSSSSSDLLYGLTEFGDVLLWDIRNTSQLNSFTDDGAVRGTCLNISDNGQFIACGSNTGIANVYDSSKVWRSSFPKPEKVFDQLTTRIDALCFNKDAQLFAFASSEKENALRIAHMRSRTVFMNFPPRGIRTGKPLVMDFSPNSGYMAVGDDKNFLTVFKLNHFDSY